MRTVPELTLEQILELDPPITTVSRETLQRRIRNGDIKAKRVATAYVVPLTKENLKAIAKRERDPKKSRNNNES